MMPMPQQFPNSYAAMMQRPPMTGGTPPWAHMPVQLPMSAPQPVQGQMQPPNPMNPVWGGNPPQAQPMQAWQGQQAQPANNFAALSNLRRPMMMQQ